ncbi:MAG: hypothetical protein JW760_00880, partial [Spirochaetales bacterium]|nr:hypothetical protein [Spirochaetales bacterium]
ASFPGMAFHLGAGVIIDLHVIEIDAGAGYRIMDYLSGTYEGFSAHFGGVGNGWYAKAGINLVFYE